MDIALLVTIKSELDVLESFIASAEYKIANLYNFRIRGKPREVTQIDPFKVNAAILLGVQTYWGERAVSHKMQMATRLNNLLLCQITLVAR